MAIFSMDVDGKSFPDQFLIPYVIEVQKIPTISSVNFVWVDQSFQLDVMGQVYLTLDRECRVVILVGPNIFQTILDK